MYSIPRPFFERRQKITFRKAAYRAFGEHFERKNTKLQNFGSFGALYAAFRDQFWIYYEKYGSARLHIVHSENILDGKINNLRNRESFGALYVALGDRNWRNLAKNCFSQATYSALNDSWMRTSEASWASRAHLRTLFLSAYYSLSMCM